MTEEHRLRERIESIDGLRDIIHGMRSLAATYLTRAERKLDGVRASADIVGDGIADCLAGRDISLPDAAPGATAFMVIFSDQGLCGRFNEILAEHVRDAAARFDDPVILAVGRRGPPLMRRHGLRLAGTLPSVTSPDDIDAVIHRAAGLLLKGHREGAFRQCHLIYAGYVSPGEIDPKRERILPLDLSPWRDPERPRHAMPRFHLGRLDLLRGLVDEYAFISLVRALTESLAAENGMRLRSMEGARANIDDTLDALQRQARLARQNAITEELLELVGGAEALRGGR